MWLDLPESSVFAGLSRVNPREDPVPASRDCEGLLVSPLMIYSLVVDDLAGFFYFLLDCDCCFINQNKF